MVVLLYNRKFSIQREKMSDWSLRFDVHFDHECVPTTRTPIVPWPIGSQKPRNSMWILQLVTRLFDSFRSVHGSGRIGFQKLNQISNSKVAKNDANTQTLFLPLSLSISTTKTKNSNRRYTYS